MDTEVLPAQRGLSVALGCRGRQEGHCVPTFEVCPLEERVTLSAHSPVLGRGLGEGPSSSDLGHALCWDFVGSPPHGQVWLEFAMGLREPLRAT